MKNVLLDHDKLYKDGYGITRATFQDKPMIRIAYPDGRVSAQPDKGQSLEAVFKEIWKPEKENKPKYNKDLIELTGKETKIELVDKLIKAKLNFEGNNWNSPYCFNGYTKIDLLKCVKRYNTNKALGGNGNISEFNNHEGYLPNRELQQKVADYTFGIGHPMDKIDKTVAKQMDSEWKEYIEKEHLGWLGHTQEEKDKAFNKIKEIIDNHLK